MTDIIQQQKMEQKLALSNQQLQSLQLLYLPVWELEQTINEAVESNPVLEYEEFSNTVSIDELSNENSSSEETSFNDDYPADDDSYSDNAETQAKRDTFLSGITEEESLQQQLLNELLYLNLSPDKQEIAEEIISNIEDSGIIGTTLADIAMVCNADLDEVESVLHLIQAISIPGVGARDLQECLKLQLLAKNSTDPQLFELIDNYLEHIGNNNLNYIAENMGITLDRLNLLLDEIRTLNPHPGAKQSENKSDFIIPEAEILYDEELSQFRLVMNDYYIPKIKISDRYSKLLEDQFLNKEDREYLRQKLSDAKNFQSSLTMREKTLEKIAKLILEEQAAFWSDGVEALKVMTMAYAAKKLDVHEATISRACAGKYILTPQGLFEFKYFFAHGVKNTSGEELSNLAIKERIQFYIDTENTEKPLSDEKIASLLEDEGINISRRTVAKYRDAMNIAPAHKRKFL